MFRKRDFQAASQLRRTLQMLAGTLPEEQAREVAMVYPAYQKGRNYRAGDYLIHGVDKNGDDLLYKVIQDHTSAAEWPPERTPSLYTCISLGPGGWPIWAPPTGAQDAYNAGDVVSHNGTLYKSKIDGNTTEPGTDERWWEVFEGVNTYE